jgi:uncharacterized membrane-anchored protein
MSLRSALAIVAGLAILAGVNYSIMGKERLLAEGRVVYLELAPVDPRSLMQGDYMALRFRAGDEALKALPRTEGRVVHGIRIPDVAPTDGRAVVALDERGIGSFARLDAGEPLAANEALLRFRVRHSRLRMATDAFYFQEGHAKEYQSARYGEFRVAPDGELLLVALRDKDLKRLGPPS